MESRNIQLLVAMDALLPKSPLQSCPEKCQFDFNTKSYFNSRLKHENLVLSNELIKVKLPP